MLETYTAPVGAARQTAKTAELFRVPLLTDAECDDSTTWNNLASAWNKARSGYFAVLYALGMENVLDAICPGKVLRLMAADVARWQARSGNGLHPDVAVWRDVPLPWQVMTGTATCTRETIRRVCARHGVNPEISGWTDPRPSARATVFRPTPELVHGVAAGHPYLAKVLRDAGYFSGKPARSF